MIVEVVGWLPAVMTGLRRRRAGFCSTRRTRYSTRSIIRLARQSGLRIENHLWLLRDCEQVPTFIGEIYSSE
jgi:hypothetical protein